MQKVSLILSIIVAWNCSDTPQQKSSTWQQITELIEQTGALTNLPTQTNSQTDLATTLLINLFDRTLIRPETVSHTYLDITQESQHYLVDKPLLIYSMFWSHS